MLPLRRCAGGMLVLGRPPDEEQRRRKVAACGRRVGGSSVGARDCAENSDEEGFGRGERERERAHSPTCVTGGAGKWVETDMRRFREKKWAGSNYKPVGRRAQILFWSKY